MAAGIVVGRDRSAFDTLSDHELIGLIKVRVADFNESEYIEGLWRGSNGQGFYRNKDGLVLAGRRRQ
jgi:hypothetical protein